MHRSRAGALALFAAAAAIGVAAAQEDEALPRFEPVRHVLFWRPHDPNIGDDQGRTALFWACSVVLRRPAEDRPDYEQTDACRCRARDSGHSGLTP